MFDTSRTSSSLTVAESFRPVAVERGLRRRLNLPLTLTLLRIFLVPLVIALLLINGRNTDFWAAGAFLVASLTDLLDGYLARKRGEVTALGIMLDPVADKLLTSSAFICLVALDQIPAWMVVIIVGREFAVTGLRGIASAKGLLLEPSDLGKAKMVLQVVGISVMILARRFPVLQPLGSGLIWMVVVFALASAGQYFWFFRRKLHVDFQEPVSGRVQIVRVSEDGEDDDRAE